MQWIPLAEWWYNTSYHTTTKMTPYEAVYGQRPPTVITYLPGTSKVQSIDTMLQGQTATLAALKDNLHMAQNCMKQHANKHHSERVFQEGYQVSSSSNITNKHLSNPKDITSWKPSFMGPTRSSSVLV